MQKTQRRYFGYRSFEPEYETMRQMRSIGIKTFTFMVSNNTNFMGAPYTKYQPTWIWEREYDFSLFDKNIADLIHAVGSDANLICFVDLNPPAWWLRRGPNRFDTFTEFGRVMSLQAWREDVAHYLQALLGHAVEQYPNVIKAFCLGGGKTTEWFDDSKGTESVSRLEAFKKYMTRQNLPVPDDIPGYSLRYSGIDESNRLLRTPEKNASALNYWKFTSAESADTLEFLIKKAREVLPAEIALSLCYGYIFELWPNCQASWSQLEYERLFSLPEIDFGLEPISYSAEERGMGGSPLSMIPMQTLKVRGKYILNSIDTTTYTSRFPAAPSKKGGSVAICGRKVEWNNAQEVAAGIKREMAYNLINGCSTWYFDMWGGWWNSETAMDTLGKAARIWDSESPVVADDVFETLLIVDPQNMYYINDAHPGATMFVNPIRKALAQAGAPFTTASCNDLSRMALDKYKLLIFCHPFDLDGDKMALLKRAISGKTVMWIYGPGIIKDGTWSPDNVKTICGVDFKTPGVTTVRMSDYHSIYVYESDKLTEKDMRAAMKTAGVHCWCEKSVPVYANSRLLAVHTGVAQELTIRLPKTYRKITELYSLREFTNSDSIHITSDICDTFLFRLED